jgi:hypothetical protein
MQPGPGGILRDYPLLRGAICRNVVSRVEVVHVPFALILFLGGGDGTHLILASMHGEYSVGPSIRSICTS